jgi:hypothetical protein
MVRESITESDGRKALDIVRYLAAWIREDSEEEGGIELIDTMVERLEADGFLADARANKPRTALPKDPRASDALRIVRDIAHTLRDPDEDVNAGDFVEGISNRLAAAGFLADDSSEPRLSDLTLHTICIDGIPQVKDGRFAAASPDEAIECWRSKPERRAVARERLSAPVLYEDTYTVVWLDSDGAWVRKDVRIAHPQELSDKHIEDILDRHRPGRSKLATVSEALAKVRAVFTPWDDGRPGDSGIYEQGLHPAAPRGRVLGHGAVSSEVPNLLKKATNVEVVDDQTGEAVIRRTSRETFAFSPSAHEQILAEHEATRRELHRGDPDDLLVTYTVQEMPQGVPDREVGERSTFEALSVGASFVFASNPEEGPWIKTSTRKYRLRLTGDELPVESIARPVFKLLPDDRSGRFRCWVVALRRPHQVDQWFTETRKEAIAAVKSKVRELGTAGGVESQNDDKRNPLDVTWSAKRDGTLIETKF